MELSEGVVGYALDTCNWVHKDDILRITTVIPGNICDVMVTIEEGQEAGRTDIAWTSKDFMVLGATSQLPIYGVCAECERPTYKVDYLCARCRHA